MNDKFDDMSRNIDSISISVIKPLEIQIRNYLDKCGLFYKVFSRIKGSKSVCDKLENRAKKNIQNYKMQDLVGIRIVLYFKSDIKLCEKLIKQHFNVLNISRDEELTDKFCPQRINYVCKLPPDVEENFDSVIWTYPIDKSFEIQIRTIFSEGWHEIEHDFRYKCLPDWENNEDLSRTLNGIFATLDNCDWAISSLLTEVAYRHYKSGEWIPMLKNTFRIRILDDVGMDEILKYFGENKEVAKEFFRIEREDFLVWLSDINTKMKIPLQLKNVVLLANLYSINDSYLKEITPKFIKDIVLESES